ncbi:MFS transporter [Citricoccus sp. NR2]|uniref:MFS transporter n=1 Tax=Citricoccus sp. NR2 TaxID=3004095 RepID=UPI0022DCEB28|nr:aromatic acid/H+ symport family MFS transporter [Citricoccus sp. NR2]WBL19563.1 aromatic acid/H+ symport family MFS transporter [Citricoccus sp. NR2]
MMTTQRDDTCRATSLHEANAPRKHRKSAAAVIFLCFVAIVFDGYDLVVYGAIVPALLEYQEWGLTPVQTGAYGSYALAGMFFGAIIVGYLTDVVGRRRVMIWSVSVFSVLMVATALAPSPELFGLFRFLAGLGLGGVIPTAIAITVEFSKPHRRNFNNALMFSGYAVGGVLSALCAIALLDVIGFRGLLAIGGLPLVTVVPLLFFLLPESPAYLRAQGRTAEAARIAEDYGIEVPSTVQSAKPVSEAEASQPAHAGAEPRGGQQILNVLRHPWLMATVLFCVAGIAGQTLVYGLNTWMPTLLVAAGYTLTSSLSFLLAVNVGAVVGAIISSRLADTFGPRPVTVVSFLSSGAALVLMGTGAFPLSVMYVLVAIVGFGSIGAQILVNGFVATYYADDTRATALGVTLGVGRIGAVLAISGGGVLVAAELTSFTNFAVWSMAALLGILAILLVPRRVKR